MFFLYEDTGLHRVLHGTTLAYPPRRASGLRGGWRESYRGTALGRSVGGASLAGARAAGHQRVVLETLDCMVAAQALYAGLGFREVPQGSSGGDAPGNVRKLECDLTVAASA